MKLGVGCMMPYKEQVCMEEVIKNMQIYHLESKVRIRWGQFFLWFYESLWIIIEGFFFQLQTIHFLLMLLGIFLISEIYFFCCSEKQVFTLQHFFNVSQNTLVSVVLYFYKLISSEINMSFNVNERRKKKGILSLDMKIVKIVYKYVWIWWQSQVYL